ncbi:hypothetical protein C3L33_22916, partial [Rhododendron williamsianum]
LFKDLTERSGLGWDPVSQTVTASAEVWLTYLQANKDAEKFIGKGLDHFDLMHELFEGLLATGVFGQPSPLGAPSSEQEQALRNQGKAIKRSDSLFSDSKKRMSDGSGGTSSKSMRSMNPLKPFVSDTAFYKAYDKLLEGVNYREGFIKLTPDGRMAWINCFGSGNRWEEMGRSSNGL